MAVNTFIAMVDINYFCRLDMRCQQEQQTRFSKMQVNDFILIIPESLCNFLFEESAESLKFQAVKAFMF
jgi:hypothetical protein